MPRIVTVKLDKQGKVIQTQNKKKQQQVRRTRRPRRNGFTTTTTMSDRFSGLGPMISAPVSQSRSFRGTQPKFASSSNGMRIRHMEYVLDLTPTTTAFSVTAYPINPGVGVIFRWLSSIANSFDSYKIHALSFSYQEKSPSSTAGSVIIAVNYDASDPVPTTKSQLMAYQCKEDIVPWRDSVIRCNPSDCNGALAKHYVRLGTVQNTDIKTYDIGTLLVATQGVPTSDLGEIIVSYDIEFFSPIDVQPFGGSITGVSGFSTTAPLGTTQTIVGTIPFTVSADGTTLTFTQGFQGLLTLVAGAIGTVSSTWSGGSATIGIFNEECTLTTGNGNFICSVQAEIGQTVVFSTSTGTPVNSIMTVTTGPFEFLLD